ncbi:hypothetical protein SH1V18_10850 [Vallitalea longa]|uniref:Peptidoglycan binding-like domain-containing protein n=1 Tax=Vallitalea longa TaxID=2936439 RepID=A0A9W6DDQ9_9FIRM|nr:hypothetical protein [Vallitalea longa]GKX28605.1 hypothetical protein SH1V18_10850 [Vallitalea longa]
MSDISINIKELVDIVPKIENISTNISGIGDKLSNIRHSLDMDIRCRQDIGENFNTLYKELNNLAESIIRSSSFVNNAIESYEEAEQRLAESFGEINQQSEVSVKENKDIEGDSWNIFDTISEVLRSIGSFLKSSINHIAVFFDKSGEVINNKYTHKKETSIPELEGTLSINNKNEYNYYAKVLQQRLNVLGYTDSEGKPLEEDGYFDYKTLEVVNKFKDEKGLWNYDQYAGKVGETTWDYLFNRAKPINPEKIQELQNNLTYNENEYNEYVKILQNRLNELGYTNLQGEPLEENGYFRKETLEAVNKYKDEKGLWNFGQYAGKVGKTTWECLFNKDKPINIDPIDNSSGKIIGTMPKQYEESIGKIMKEHPNWTFEFIEAPVTWDNLINAQDKVDTNLIEITTPESYREYDPNNADGWSPPKRQVIEYYADPRNFISNEENLFQFLYLGYEKNANDETTEGVKSILENTVHLKYVDTIMEAAEKSKVSAYYLAAKLRGEAGANGNPLTRGKEIEGTKYYNPYNWNASGKTDKEVLRKGALYAKKKGWDSMQKGIIGGAIELGEKFISIGQNTVYTQKFDIVGDSYYTHQYMQNIQVSKLEGSELYKVFKNTEALDEDLVFKIPIYSGMPDNTSLPE